MNSNIEVQPSPFLIWDTCDIAMAQAKYLVEIGETDNEEKAFDQACQDTDLLSFEWDYLTESLTETLNALNPSGNWMAKVTGFGWRKQDGYKEIQADNGSDFLKSIFPETDCSFKLFQDEKGIKIQNFHHDSPTGNEWYDIQPVIN